MKEEKKTTKRVFNLLIVDESGSMEIIRRQAFAGLNETLQTVMKLQEMHKDIEQHVTLLTFDSSHQRFIYDNVLACDIKPLTWNDYVPRAATPLYDAIGRGIARVNAQTTKGDNVLVTIITDGEENSSREYRLDMVRTLIEKLKNQGWTFTLIGTDNLDVETMAAGMAIDDHLMFTENAEDTQAMFELDRSARMSYNCCLSENVALPRGKHFSRKRV